MNALVSLYYLVVERMAAALFYTVFWAPVVFAMMFVFAVPWLVSARIDVAILLNTATLVWSIALYARFRNPDWSN